MIKVKIVEPYLISNRKIEDKRYFIRIVEQNLSSLVISKLYHWYDTKLFRYSGVFRFLDKHFPKENEIPREILQDIRCDRLSQRGKETITAIEIEPGLYEKITKGVDDVVV